MLILNDQLNILITINNMTIKCIGNRKIYKLKFILLSKEGNGADKLHGIQEFNVRVLKFDFGNCI